MAMEFFIASTGFLLKTDQGRGSKGSKRDEEAWQSEREEPEENC